ncbi:MAG: hypothetical protein H7301_08375 [Cryobacterium sp.]|nr:hypothetical protein [Oligoflexia bacterium]
MKVFNLVFALALSTLGSLSSVYADEPTPEMRAQMAGMHQMMADCLKSAKPVSECKQKMMKDCPMMKATGHCPVMGEMDAMMKGDHAGHEKAKKAAESEHH